MKDVGKIILAIIVIVIVWKLLKGLIGLLVGLAVAGLVLYGAVKLVEGMGTKRISNYERGRAFLSSASRPSVCGGAWCGCRGRGGGLSEECPDGFGCGGAPWVGVGAAGGPA